MRSNKFTWMGFDPAARRLHLSCFQETEWGPFIAHAYQYEAEPLDVDFRDRSGDVQGGPAWRA